MNDEISDDNNWLQSCSPVNFYEEFAAFGRLSLSWEDRSCLSPDSISDDSVEDDLSSEIRRSASASTGGACADIPLPPAAYHSTTIIGNDGGRHRSLTMSSSEIFPLDFFTDDVPEMITTRPTPLFINDATTMTTTMTLPGSPPMSNDGAIPAISSPEGAFTSMMLFSPIRQDKEDKKEEVAAAAVPDDVIVPDDIVLQEIKKAKDAEKDKAKPDAKKAKAKKEKITTAAAPGQEPLPPVLAQEFRVLTTNDIPPESSPYKRGRKPTCAFHICSAADKLRSLQQGGFVVRCDNCNKDLRICLVCGFFHEAR
jgi:hypothetical protein